MASSNSGGDILKYGLLAVGGYLLYTWWVGQTAVATTPVSTPTPTTTTTGTTTTTITPTTTTTPVITTPALSAKLESLAGTTGGTQNADQWSYYLTQLAGVALTPAQFTAAFPSLTSTNRGSYTAQQFVAALASAGLAAPAGYGLNGLGQLRPIVPVPVPFRPVMRRRSW